MYELGFIELMKVDGDPILIRMVEIQAVYPKVGTEHTTVRLHRGTEISVSNTYADIRTMIASLSNLQ